MNTKIVELIKEHGFMFDEDLVEFAELIVKECIKSVESNIETNTSSFDEFDVAYNSGVNSSISSIRNLFEIY